VAILVAGVGLLSAEHIPVAVSVVVFLAGAASALISILANQTQHDYYKNVRDLKRDIENRLELGDLAVATTLGMGGMRGRIARVTTFQNLILGALLAADLAGVGVSVGQAMQATPDPKIALVARVVGHHDPPRSVPLVLSRRGRIAVTATLNPTETVTLRLRPGRYQVAVFAAGRLCKSTVSVTTTPLQSLAIRCR
jgi:hypothetical protein